MNRLFGMGVAATVALSTTAFAAVEHERVRGIVSSVANDTLTVRTAAGQDVPVILSATTKHLCVVKSSLDAIEKDSGAMTNRAHVFVNASKDNGKVMANSVAVGADGLRPPM